MGFWEEHYATQAKAPKPEAAQKAQAGHSQNAPAECADCGLTKDDVLLGICGLCFAAYKAAKW